MMRSLVHPPRWRLLVVVFVCTAIVAGALLWYAIRHEGGAQVVAESTKPGWKTIQYDDVRVTIPSAWERSDMDDCEFEFEQWAPPDSEDCKMFAGVAFYASATFDPARGPGVGRTEARGEPDWGGYTYAGEFAVYASDDDREIVQQVLRSAH
jgi:hypothetical protein